MDVINELEGMFALHKSYLEYYGIFKISHMRVYLKTNWLNASKVTVLIRGEKTCWMNADEFIIDQCAEAVEIEKNKLIMDRVFNKLTFQVNV